MEINGNTAIEQAAMEAEKSVGFLSQTIDDLIHWLIEKSGSAFIAVIVIAIGIKLVGLFVKGLKKSFERSKMDASVAGFLLSIVRVLGYVLVFITAATIVGFEVTSFVTILGTASLSVGLALQGALSNLAGGVLILILKPFQVGDYIVENNKGTEGTVVSIDIFYTRLKTHDNKIVVIPNGLLADNSLVNLTEESIRKIEIKVMIAYDSDMKQVKKIVGGLLKDDSQILKDQPMDIFIDSFEDSGMKLCIRAWVNTEDYWPVTWRMREQVKQEFDRNHIRIPFNRLEVEMIEK